MVVLKADEEKLLEQYRAMNTSGKERMFEMAEFCMLRYPITIIPISVFEQAKEKKAHVSGFLTICPTGLIIDL